MKKISTITFCGYLIASSFLSIAFYASPANAEGKCVCTDGTIPTRGCTKDTPDCDNACGPNNQNGTCSDSSGTPTPTPTPSPSATSSGKLFNPLSGVCSETTPGQLCVQLIIGNIIRAALGIVGSIALLMMTYGGFRWLTAMGNSEKVEKGKDTLIWAALGLAVIFGAYAITSYIIDKLLTGK